MLFHTGMVNSYGPYYRPQTKFAKVMFLQVCVCPQGGRAWQGACIVGVGGVHGGGGAYMGCVHGGECMAMTTDIIVIIPVVSKVGYP